VHCAVVVVVEVQDDGLPRLLATTGKRGNKCTDRLQLVFSCLNPVAVAAEQRPCPSLDSNATMSRKKSKQQRLQARRERERASGVTPISAPRSEKPKIAYDETFLPPSQVLNEFSTACYWGDSMLTLEDHYNYSYYSYKDFYHHIASALYKALRHWNRALTRKEVKAFVTQHDEEDMMNLFRHVSKTQDFLKVFQIGA
jgi:hypothetical protein